MLSCFAPVSCSSAALSVISSVTRAVSVRDRGEFLGGEGLRRLAPDRMEDVGRPPDVLGDMNEVDQDVDRRGAVPRPR